MRFVSCSKVGELFVPSTTTGKCRTPFAAKAIVFRKEHDGKFPGEENSVYLTSTTCDVHLPTPMMSVHHHHMQNQRRNLSRLQDVVHLLGI
jgi:hypothetical protein